MSDKNNKLDMGSFIKNIKSMLPQNVVEPKPVTGDSLGESLAELSRKAKDAAKMHAEITQTLYDIEHGINQLYADIETLRSGEGEVGSETETKAEAEATADESIIEEYTAEQVDSEDNTAVTSSTENTDNSAADESEEDKK